MEQEVSKLLRIGVKRFAGVELFFGLEIEPCFFGNSLV
jgi:hypothetical protein